MEPTTNQILDKIEELCYQSDNETYLIHPERYDKKLVALSQSISDIYTIAHAYNTNHSCYHVHGDWRTL